MLVLTTTYPNKPRDCKKFILGLVKSGMVACVQKIQYVKSYYMREWKLTQEEEKILIIKLSENNKEKVIGYFLKNHPYKIPEMIWNQPNDVNETYEKRVNDIKKIAA